MSLTVAEVVKRTGVSQNTLIRWARERLIPSPTVVPHPDHERGMVGILPDDVVVIIERIKVLQRDGHRLKAIMPMLHREQLDLGTNRFNEIDKEAESIADRLVRPPGANKPERFYPTAAEVLADQIQDIVRYWGPEAARKLDPPPPMSSGRRAVMKWSADIHAGQRRWFRTAYYLLAVGMSPVWVFDGREAHVVPDFIVSHLVSTRENVEIQARARNGKVPKGFTTRFSFCIPLEFMMRGLIDAVGGKLPTEISHSIPALSFWDLKDPPVERGFRIQYDSAVGLSFNVMPDLVRPLRWAPKRPSKEKRTKRSNAS